MGIFSDYLITPGMLSSVESVKNIVTSSQVT
jgi:hypothetical protein